MCEMWIWSNYVYHVTRPSMSQTFQAPENLLRPETTTKIDALLHESHNWAHHSAYKLKPIVIIIIMWIYYSKLDLVQGDLFLLLVFFPSFYSWHNALLREIISGAVRFLFRFTSDTLIGSNFIITQTSHKHKHHHHFSENADC